MPQSPVQAWQEEAVLKGEIPQYPTSQAQNALETGLAFWEIQVRQALAEAQVAHSLSHAVQEEEEISGDTPQ